jgi:RNA polymerase sigma-70 factor (ECF subfamily)
MSIEPTPSDEQVIARVCAGERDLFAVLLRRHNQRVYRAVRSILRDQTESEDAMQEAYVQAFRHLADFEGRSQFSTWLIKIAVREAIARRKRASGVVAEGSATEETTMAVSEVERADPERSASRREIGRLLEQAIDALPEYFRTVFMLRAVEELSVAETASCLEIPEETVKTRLHRARGLLQEALLARAESAAPGAFPFEAPRCDRVVAAVLQRLGREVAR